MPAEHETMTAKLLRSALLYESHGEASDLPERAADLIDAQAATIASLRIDLEHVETKRAMHKAERDDADAANVKLNTTIASLQAALAVAREALEPFKKVADAWDFPVPELRDADNVVLLHRGQPADDVTLGMFRQARDASVQLDASLKGAHPAQGGE